MSDFTEANRVAWEERAHTYDSEPYLQKVTSQVREALSSRLDWIGAAWADPSVKGSECSLLDYACGTGNVSLALSNKITSTTGIDISTSMTTVFQTRFSTSFPNLKVQTQVGDLVSPTPSPSLNDPSFFEFDIAAIGLGFHHFEEPERCLRRLVERVKKGTGVVVIVDWLPHGDHHGHSHHGQEEGHGHEGHGQGQHHGRHHHGHDDNNNNNDKTDKATGNEDSRTEVQKLQHTVKHHGSSKDTMAAMFEAAGLVDFGFEELEEDFVLVPKGKEIVRRGFVAKGRRA